jgi:hypothetical protein
MARFRRDFAHRHGHIGCATPDARRESFELRSEGVMLTKRTACCAIAIVLLTACAASTASAVVLDDRVYFTFSGPVALPGVDLAPGKYMFRLADPTNSRHVVQVASADGRTSYGIFFTFEAVRDSPAPAPEVRFMETPAGVPPAIRAYWNTGEIYGQEFIYPKEQARRLAQTSKTPVLTTEADTKTTAQTNTANLARLSPGGPETKMSSDGKATEKTAPGAEQSGEQAPDSIDVPVVVVVLVPKAPAR